MPRHIAPLVLAISLALSSLAHAQASTDPETLFKSRGLTHMGFWLILPGEADLHDSVRQLASAKAKIRQDKFARYQADEALKQAQAQLDQIEAQLNQVNGALDSTGSHLKAIDKDKTPGNYNNVVDDYNLILGHQRMLEAALERQISQIDDLRKQSQQISNSGSTYINLASNLSIKAESVAATYAALAKDSQLAAAIDLYNQTNTPHARLGPSGLFADDLQTVRLCAKDVVTGGIPVTTVAGGDPSVQAVLNEKITIPMIWDSGASDVTLTAATATGLGLNLTDNTHKTEMVVADGRKITAAVITLDSVRVGSFTVKNVECLVLPPDAPGSDDLLGDTFQHCFIARLDQNAGTLQLTATDPGVAYDPDKPLPTAPTPAPDAAIALAPGATNLLPSMQCSPGQLSHDTDGSVILQDDQHLTTPQSFTPPISFKIVAQTDSTNLRISYAADQIIFNWERNQNQLRINGGPADGHNKPHAGKIPTDKWVTIDLTVLPDTMTISVNGKKRYSTQADFSQINQPLSIFPAVGSVVKVKSVSVGK